MIRGPAGSVFYLLEKAPGGQSLFAKMFVAVAAAPAPARLLRSIILPRRCGPIVLSVLMFYRAISGFGSEAQRAVLTPTAHVRTASCNGNGRCGCVNSSQEAGRRRAASRPDRAGGLYSFRLRTDDIYASPEACRGRGAGRFRPTSTRPVPAFRPAGETVAAMRALGFH